jgi:cell division transport system ATP-binding protein
MATTEAEILAREAAHPTAPPVVEFRRVSKRYDNGMGLDDASFTVGRGEFVFLVGSTGSGKSTSCACSSRSSSRPRDDPRRRARPGRDHAQEGALLPAQPRRRLPGLQAAAQPHGARQRRLRAAGHRQLAQGGPRQGPGHPAPHGLSTKLHHFPDQLSGGEQQRVSVARAFVNHPPLLLADEPTGNLDPETSIGIMQLLYRINRTGTTVIVATHDSAMVDRMRRRVIELSRGRIIRDEVSGLYAQRDMSTPSSARSCASPRRRPAASASPGDDFDEAFRD